MAATEDPFAIAKKLGHINTGKSEFHTFYGYTLNNVRGWLPLFLRGYSLWVIELYSLCRQLLKPYPLYRFFLAGEYLPLESRLPPAEVAAMEAIELKKKVRPYSLLPLLHAFAT